MVDKPGATVLLIEPDPAQQIKLANLLQQRGWHSCSASDTSEVLSLMLKYKPDLVILAASNNSEQDIATATELKQLVGDEYLPVIFATGMAEAGLLNSYLTVGDDVVSKPYNASILAAKIAALLKVRAMHATLLQQRQQLEKMNLHVHQEQQIAKKVFDKVAHAGCLDSDNIQYVMRPVSGFNGDVMLAGRGPSGNLMVLMGDFTGHGLNAAIGAMPMAQTFYSMLDKGFPVQDIVREINLKLHEILPVGIFCCAAIADLDFNARNIRIWSGGLPDCYLQLQQQRQLQTIPSSHVPLGILADSEFNDTVQSYNVMPGDRLYLWSDGILEAQNRDGEMFGDQRIQAVLQSHYNSEQAFQTLLDAFDNFVAKEQIDDDISLIEVCFTTAEKQSLPAQTQASIAALGDTDWSLIYELRAESLRNTNMLPLLLHTVTQVPQMQLHRGQLYTIFAELLSNALEHGVLSMDSGLKADAEGFANYYRLRTERLSELQQGFVRVQLDFKSSTQADAALTVTVEDSGEGFDVAAYQARLAADTQFAGRGMVLLQQLCESVQYNERGNMVQVVYRL